MIAYNVDETPAASNDTAWLASFEAHLGTRLKIKDLGDISHLLGIHTTRDMSTRTISLDKSKYFRDIRAQHGMIDSKPSSLPMDPGFLSGLARMDSPLLT
jgi:hypothetical protein